MTSVAAQLRKDALIVINELFQLEIAPNQLTINETKPEFEGNYTVVIFPLVKLLGKKPQEVAQPIGEKLVEKFPYYTSFTIIQGFVNLTISDSVFNSYLQECLTNGLEHHSKTGQKVMIEFSSPNTNKPLHLGHLRNNFLGESTSRILKATGNEVIKTNLLNDRGIHICKSMYEWQTNGDNKTPESIGIKGDHLVGDFYVAFEQKMKKDAAVLIEKILAGDQSFIEAKHQDQVSKLVQAYNEQTVEEKKKDILAKISEIARLHTDAMLGARKLLLQWEQKDPATYDLWKKMNQWVIAGFEATYKKLGISFDKYYFESETYLLGKDIVEKGLEKGVCYKKEDGSVWIDLTAEGLDEKILLRGDGTSVYITQDLGTARLKYQDYAMDKSLYVIADEQNYHMQVLQLTLEKIGEPYAAGIHHLSYGLVELPTGRMKTREGTVVDADEIIDEMIAVAAKHTQEAGKIEQFTDEQLQNLYEQIGIGALKFFLLRVDPKKKMIFNPEESIDFHGFTGPFVQYCHARCCAILRKENFNSKLSFDEPLLDGEKDLLQMLEQWTATKQEAANEYSPSIICNYVFNLAKQFNSFLGDHRILNAESENKKQLRLQLTYLVKTTLAAGLDLLSIDAVERM